MARLHVRPLGTRSDGYESTSDYMIGMILVTHGRLAEEFVHAMEHVVGEQADVATICIGPNDDMEARRPRSPTRSSRSISARAR